VPLKGDKAEPGNYRPVSLTSVMCKTMEKLVREIIVKHMSANKLFSNKQIGFISGRSTGFDIVAPKLLEHFRVKTIWAT
jgi:hypothetical protein